MTRLHASASPLHRRPSTTALHRRSRRATRSGTLQRAVGNHTIASAIRDGLDAPAQPLDFALRVEMERRLGRDFSNVRVHVHGQAAARVEARAFAFGDDIVLASSREQALLPHELTHVAQQRGRALAIPTRLARPDEPAERSADATPAPDALHRASAEKLSCGAGPLTLADGSKVPSPSIAISAAETIAIHWLRHAADELAHALGRIKAGAAIGWPTISETLGQAMRLVGLNPEAAVVWNGSGPGSAEYVLERFRRILAVLGTDTIFYHCLATNMRRLSTCQEEAAGICKDSNAAACSGSNEIALCEGFWAYRTLDARARVILHEHFHNDAKIYGHTGRLHNIMCYERFAQVLSGVAEEHQRTDFCPNP